MPEVLPEAHTTDATIDAVAKAAHVRLSGDIEGSYVVEEARADGRLLVAPDWPSPETSAKSILERAEAEPLGAAEFQRHFGHLPTDDEG